MPATNRYCDALKIETPRLEAVVGHREASAYSLLIVAILEHGAPMTLAEAAARLEAAPALGRSRRCLGVVEEVQTGSASGLPRR